MLGGLARWPAAANRRRLLFFALAAIQTTFAIYYVLKVLPQHGETPIELAIVILFGVLFAWVSLGFWTAFMGFWAVLLRRKRYAISSLVEDLPLDDEHMAKTAIVMPVCNEDPARTFAGLRATYRSLAKTGLLDHFEFFVLSDSGDPNVWIQEEKAWAQWCRDEQDWSRIHYRRRRVRIKRKTGNLADFCRRWGGDFRYMLVLDADSIMSGETIARMVQVMEKRREIGILQTAPHTVKRESLYARIQQFGTHAYSALFTAGLNFWQMGEGYYWGHNAIIRVAPFIEHCCLERMSGSGAMGGEILSHDFVEAAYMRRAGWEVWLAYDFPGSWEEPPPTLLDELKRDRRWSQGNLQHLRLVFQAGLNPIHRVMFFYGMMAYGSALFWFILLGLSTVDVIQQVGQETTYFSNTPTLFPQWRIWNPEWVYGLVGATATLLFLPKFLGIFLMLTQKGQVKATGGFIRLCLSVFLEAVFSALLAPVRMLFHSKYVVMTLLGKEVGWGTQQREDASTLWREAFRHHIGGTLLALVWGGAVYVYQPEYLIWLSPIIGSLLLAIPVSVLSSRVSVGRFFARLGLFLIPEETKQPDELNWLDQYTSLEPEGMLPRYDGFTQAIVDPVVNALHLDLLRENTGLPPATEMYLEELHNRALQEGPDSLDNTERNVLLDDAKSVARLHVALWQTDDLALLKRWGLDPAMQAARSASVMA